MGGRAAASWACGRRSPQMLLPARPPPPWPPASTGRCLAPTGRAPLRTQHHSGRRFAAVLVNLSSHAEPLAYAQRQKLYIIDIDCGGQFFERNLAVRAPCTVQVVCFLCLRASALLLCGCLHARLWIGCKNAGACTSALLHVRLEQGEAHKGLICVVSALTTQLGALGTHSGWLAVNRVLIAQRDVPASAAPATSCRAYRDPPQGEVVHAAMRQVAA